MVCPFGAIKPDLKNKKVGSKCDFCATFDMEKEKYKILSSPFIKLSPFSLRPYGRLYAY